MFVPKWIVRAVLATAVCALAAVGASWFGPGVLTVGAAFEPAQEQRGGSQPAGEAVGNHPPPTYICCDKAEPVNGKGGSAISGAYEVVKDWPVLPHGPEWEFATVAGMAIDGHRIIAVTRGERRPLKQSGWGAEVFRALNERTGNETLRDHLFIVIDRNSGKVIENWDRWSSTLKTGQRVLISPYDPEKQIWVSGGGQLFRFSNDGQKLIQTVENKDIPEVAGAGAFNPEGLGWLPNGDFWAVSAARLVKFSKDGKYLTQVGTLGSGRGQFRGAHDIAIDGGKNRMYVADRQNSRIVVTDLNGTYLDEWPNVVSPYSVRLTKDGRYLWVGDGWIQKMQKYDAMSGTLLYQFGTFGTVPGTFFGLHYFTTDAEGNFYLCEDYGGRIQKFRPKKDADPAELLGELMW